MGKSFFLSNLLLILFLCSILCASMADPNPVHQTESKATAYIVFTLKPHAEEPEAYHIRTLASVVGSEDAAKKALLYIYKYVATGFAAKLTPEQAALMSSQPGVCQVLQSQTYQLLSGGAAKHSGPGLMHI